jgi:hypothetical protein
MTKLSTKPRIHVVLHCGNNNNNYGNDDDKCDDKASCASAQHNSHCAQVHMLRVKHRRNNQPGNVKLRRA